MQVRRLQLPIASLGLYTANSTPRPGKKRPALRAVADRFTVQSTVLTSAHRLDWAFMLLGENTARQISLFGSAQLAATEHT
jgi:hypothetical protein